MDGKIIIEITKGKAPVYEMQGNIGAPELLNSVNNLRRHYMSVYLPGRVREHEKAQAQAKVKAQQEKEVAAKKAELAKAQAEKDAAPKPIDVAKTIVSGTVKK